MDNLVICNRCGSNACYTKQLNSEFTTYQCYGCGFTTNSLMKKTENFLKEQMEKLPKLHKELLGEDEDGFVWMPQTINIANKGMVFANGKNGDNWKWSAVLAVPVLEEEKEKYPDPEGGYYKFRMDTKNIKRYDKNCFMDAAELIGMFES